MSADTLARRLRDARSAIVAHNATIQDGGQSLYLEAADRIEALEAELAAVREQEKYRGRFAGWFREERSAMSYRLWSQGGADQQPGEIALYE